MIDTSVWIALMNTDDSCHNESKKIVRGIDSRDLEIFDHIHSEVLTVLRRKGPQHGCRQFLSFLKAIEAKVSISNEKIYRLATDFFFKFSKLSFTDCLIMAAAKRKKAKLITFDKALQKAWNSL